MTMISRREFLAATAAAGVSGMPAAPSAARNDDTTAAKRDAKQEKQEPGSLIGELFARDPVVAYGLLALVVLGAGVALLKGKDVDLLGLLKIGGEKKKDDAGTGDRSTPGDARAVVQVVNNFGTERTVVGTDAREEGVAAPGPPADGPAEPAPADHHESTSRVAAVSVPIYWRRARPLFEEFNARQKYAMRSFRWTLEITEDFSVATETVREIVAVDRPLVAICGGRTSDVPCPRFQDLRLEALEGPATPGGPPRPLLWLPTTDHPLEKQFIIFLREPLLPQDGSVFLTLRSVWPRAAQRLESTDDGDLQRFVLPKMAHGDIPAPDLRIKLPAARGRFRVTCGDPMLDIEVPHPETGAVTVPVNPGPSKPGREIRCMVTRLP